MMAPRWHRALPWNAARLAFRAFRRRFFWKRPFDGRYFEVHASEEKLLKAFGQRSFAPNWEFSYSKGEQINLARVVWEFNAEYEDIVWWQTHVRMWRVREGVWHVKGHWEAEPTEHPLEHLNGTGAEHLRGMANIRRVLDDNGIQFGEVQLDGRAVGEQR